MKTNYRFFTFHFPLFLVCALLPSLAFAQRVTFESTEEYRSLGAYDTWEQSPFRTGVLNGSNYVALVANPDMEEKDAPGVATNASENVLAVQRSRYGSNTFGARVDLNEPFCLGTSKRYVHVLVNKPEGEGGVVMLIGLGKRHDWEGQKPETEQFWVTASLSTQGQWNDLVFPVTTNESVDIHSLVVVPDLASPHLRTSDFVAYIDDIELNDSPRPRYQVINYPLNFDSNQKPTRTDRALTKLTFTGEGVKDVTVPTTTVYNNLTETAMVFAKAGSDVTVKMTYRGAWMSGYAYVDWNNDGQFTPVIEDHKPAEGSELVSYTFLSGYNSNGASQANGNSVVDGAITCPAFTIPEGTQPGVYRMRLKVDWDNADAGGNDNANNLLTANGGAEKTDTTYTEVPLNYYTVTDSLGHDSLVVASDSHGPIWEAIDATEKAEGYTALDTEELAIWNANSGKGRGWKKVEISGVNVDNHMLVIGFTTNSQRTGKECKAAWVSATDFTLTLTEQGDNTGWDGPITGISAVPNEKRANAIDGIYTLSGARVAAPQRGLYIIVQDGKSRKVIIR